MQTLIVHSRHPVRFVRALGPARALAAAALIAGSVFGGLFGPALFLETLWRAFRGDLAGAEPGTRSRRRRDLHVDGVGADDGPRSRSGGDASTRHGGARRRLGGAAPLLRADLSSQLGRAARSGDPAVPLGQDGARASPRRDPRTRARAHPRPNGSRRIRRGAPSRLDRSSVPAIRSRRRPTLLFVGVGYSDRDDCEPADAPPFRKTGVVACQGWRVSRPIWTYTRPGPIGVSKWASALTPACVPSAEAGAASNGPELCEAVRKTPPKSPPAAT